MDPKILIVDDDPVTLMYLAKVLNKHHYRYDTAENGKQALLKMENANFNVLLTDISMPEMDGKELIGIVNKNYPEMVIVVMSVDVDVDNLLATLNENKAYSYLIKPLDPENLLSVLERAFDHFIKLQKAEMFSESEQKLYQNILDTFEWKDELHQKQVASIAKDTIRQINISFSHGSGFGALLSTLSLLFSMAKYDKVSNSYNVPQNLYEVIKSNYHSSTKMMDCFSKAQTILMENDYCTTSEQITRVKTVLEQRSEKMTVLADIKNQKVSIGELPRNISEKKILFDHEKIDIVFTELLINAMKYSQKNDKIFVMLFAKENHLEVKFLNPAYANSDGSVGIVGKNEKTVFEPFYRISSVMDDNYAKHETFSYGLGLPIVKKIMDLHRASIYIYTVKNLSLGESTMDVCVTLKFPIIKE